MWVYLTKIIIFSINHIPTITLNIVLTCLFFYLYHINQAGLLELISLIQELESPRKKIHLLTAGDVLTTYSGIKIDCCVMEYKGKSAGSYQKFWIDKKGGIVLKEEDFFNNRYRFKLKLEVSKDN